MSPPTYGAIRAQIERNCGEESLFAYRLRQRMDADDPGMRLDVNPDYQRGHVWTLSQSAALVGHLLEGGETPTLTIQRWPARTGKPDEVVDGKQRLLAVLGFVEGNIPARLSDGRDYYLSEWDTSDQHRISRGFELMLRARIVSCATRADVLRLYLRLNRGGSIHTDEEIARVRDLLAKEPTT